MRANAASALRGEIDLVDGEDELADAEQREEDEVAPDRRRQPLPDVDDDDAQIGGRGGGHDPARIAILAGDVVDDEVAPVGRARRGRKQSGERALAAARAAAEVKAQRRSERARAAFGDGTRVCVARPDVDLGEVVLESVSVQPASGKRRTVSPRRFVAWPRRQMGAGWFRAQIAARAVDHEIEAPLGGRRRERLAGR